MLVKASHGAAPTQNKLIAPSANSSDGSRQTVENVSGQVPQEAIVLVVSPRISSRDNFLRWVTRSHSRNSAPSKDKSALSTVELLLLCLMLAIVRWNYYHNLGEKLANYVCDSKTPQSAPVTHDQTQTPPIPRQKETPVSRLKEEISCNPSNIPVCKCEEPSVTVMSPHRENTGSESDTKTRTAGILGGVFSLGALGGCIWGSTYQADCDPLDDLYKYWKLTLTQSEFHLKFKSLLEFLETAWLETTDVALQDQFESGMIAPASFPVIGFALFDSISAIKVASSEATTRMADMKSAEHLESLWQEVELVQCILIMCTVLLGIIVVVLLGYCFVRCRKTPL